MASDKKWIIFVGFLLGYALWLVFGLTLTFKSSSDPVAFWGLSEQTNSLILLIIWPIGSSLVVLLVGVRIIAPVFVKIMKFFKKDQGIAYIPRNLDPLTGNVAISRLFNVFLITLGITEAMLAAGYLIPNNFITELRLIQWTAAGIDPRYTPIVLSLTLCLIIPLSVGIWAVSWTLEDAGLLVYEIPSRGSKDNFYEIRPLHNHYADYISGFGGISSLVFYFGFLTYFFTDYSQSGGNYADLVLILFLGLVSLSILPIYWIYTKIPKTFLLQGVGQAPMLTEDNFEIKK